MKLLEAIYKPEEQRFCYKFSISPYLNILIQTTWLYRDLSSDQGI